METALQPCGWLATYVGVTLADIELLPRNLDGDLTFSAEILPTSGSVRTRGGPPALLAACLLCAGWAARGPLVICEYSATTVVPPTWCLRVDRFGGLVLERA